MTLDQALARIEALEEEVAYWKGEAGALAASEAEAAFQRTWGLTPGAARLLAFLWNRKGKLVSKWGLVEAFYHDRPDRYPSIKIVDVWIYHIRKRIGFEMIGSVWAKGVFLTEDGLKACGQALDFKPPLTEACEGAPTDRHAA